MSLKYKILWVDDTPTWVESITDIISSSLEEEGFTYTHSICADPKNLSEFLPDPEIALVAVDKNLTETTKGEDVIRHIRQDDRCINILFYSQSGPPTGDAKPMDGVFFRHRDEVPDMVIQLFQSHLERSLGLNMTRGLLIAEAINIENTLTHAIAEFMGPRKEFYLENILRKLPSPYDFQKKVVFVVRALRMLADEAKAEGNAKREQVLRKLKDRIGSVPKEVLVYRNIFAHGEWFTNDKGQIALRGINKDIKELPFTKEACKEIRLKFHEHASNVAAARDFLASYEGGGS